MNEIKNRNLLFEKSVLLPLIILLCFSVLYRATFINGVIYQTDFDHVSLASQYSSIFQSFFSTILSGNWNELGSIIDSFRASIQTYGISSSISYLPVSISYAVFGVTDYAGLVFPLACSLLGSLFLYGTGTILGGQKAGLVSVFIWSILPVEIFYSTIISTALPIFMFSQAGIFLFLLINHTEKNRKLLIFLNILCIAILYFINPASLSILLFYFIYWVRNHNNKKILSIGFIIFYLIFIAIFCFLHQISDFPQAIFQLYQSASTEGGWFIILTLFLSALVGFSYKKSPDLSVSLLWLATIYPVLTLMSYTGVGIEKALLMYYAPIVTTIAIFLTNLISDKEAKNTTVIYAISMGILVWLAGLEKDTDVLLNQQALITPALIFPISTIALGISFVGAAISNVFVTGEKQQWKNYAAFFVIWILGFSLIQHVNFSNRYARHIQFSSLEAYNFITNTDMPLPIYSDDPIMLERIKYLSGFQMENLNGISAIAQDENENEINLADAYIILSTNSPIKIEDNWVPIKRIGKTWFNNYWIYRILSDSASAEIINGPGILSNENLESEKENDINLYRANINTGKTCEGYTAWMKYAELSTQIESIPVIDHHCFQLSDTNIVDPTRWNHSSYSYGLLYSKIRQGTEIITYHKKKYSDLNTILQKIELKPDTFYYLELSVSSDDTQTMIVPYLIIGDQDIFLESGQYPEWTKFQMMFKTQDSPSESLESYISPFLFEGSHISHFKDFQIREIQTD